MTKIYIPDLIISSKVLPFVWGDTEHDITRIFPEWKERIEELKASKYPYIEVDSVEFYFDRDNFEGLTEIIIKVLNFTKSYDSFSFNPGWINNRVTFKKVLFELAKLTVKFSVEYSKHFQSPVIIINNNVFLAFEDIYDSKSKENSRLQKISIRK